MGRDKALLSVDGVPLLQKVCEVAIGLCDRVYVVTPWQERYEHLLPVGCEFIREQGAGSREQGTGDKGTRGTRGPRDRREWGLGAKGTRGQGSNSSHQSLAASNSPITNSPLTGFAQGLIHVQTEWVLLLACDLPCLRLEVLQDWTRELVEMPKEAIACFRAILKAGSLCAVSIVAVV
ncbi:MAG: Molybdenum cofactor guanylyltransferase [Chroococcidiopsis cubana SAG 39.79]|uniref:NTP transferase domain-containing protein n=1 Tax=Chroococcidiopsis cubana TaxID=171392 RepID=UPI002AC559B6|nr:NTP transferase domain-containing protein [Chroococcidiopsis cubana]MDZ4875842.1 Molybdenum cofactor guanylyltransferase [Chroococcidiopsis cubana SAG 39.79]